MNTIQNQVDLVDYQGMILTIVSAFTYISLAFGYLIMFYGFYKQAQYKKQLKQTNQNDATALEELKKKREHYGKVTGRGFILVIVATLMWFVVTVPTCC